MLKKKEVNNNYIAKLERHIEEAKKSAKYSSDRFDILIITLSSGLLLLSINFTSEIISDLCTRLIIFIKLSWLFFVLSMISNLLSQVTGYYAHKYDIATSEIDIQIERKTCSEQVISSSDLKKSEDKRRKYDEKCSRVNNYTHIFNITSISSLILGIIFLLIFFINI